MAMTACTADEVDWQLTPDQFVFPSKGIPTITITFARVDSETSSYTYTANEALTANNQYNILGTYTEPLGVTLAGTIALQPWPTDPTPVDFDFDEQNASNNTPTNPSTDPTTDPSEAPVTGQIYKGCYVVSVDESNHTAVLLSPTEEYNYKTKMGNNGYSDWQTCAKAELKNWPSIEGVIGTWRLPTYVEVEKFAQFPGVIDVSRATDGFVLFCSQWTYARIKYNTNTNAIKVSSPNTTTLSDTDTLRPVIDITY